jgi:hypothetical protein
VSLISNIDGAAWAANIFTNFPEKKKSKGRYGIRRVPGEDDS